MSVTTHNEDQISHDYPKGHIWGPWMSQRGREGTKPATQYRSCQHPSCKAWQEREAPNG